MRGANLDGTSCFYCVGPQGSVMSKVKEAPYVTRQDIEAYLDLDERRKAFNRQADDLKKQQDAIAEKLMTFVSVRGGSDKSVERSGFVLAIHTARCAVKWKEEFVKVQGLAVAEALTAAQPSREYLSVEKAA